jgi:hypothetical protein
VSSAEALRRVASALLSGRLLVWFVGGGCFLYLLLLRIFAWCKAEAAASGRGHLLAASEIGESATPLTSARKSVTNRFLASCLWLTLSLPRLLAALVGSGVDSPTKAAAGFMTAAALGASAYAYFVEVVSRDVIVTVNASCVSTQPGYLLHISIPNQDQAQVQDCTFRLWPRIVVGQTVLPAGRDLGQAYGDLRSQPFACGREAAPFQTDVSAALVLESAELATAVARLPPEGGILQDFDLRVDYRRGPIGIGESVVKRSIPCVAR